MRGLSAKNFLQYREIKEIAVGSENYRYSEKEKNNSENKEKMFAVKRAYQKWCARYCIMQ